MSKVKIVAVKDKEYKLLLSNAGIIAAEDKLGENLMNEVIKYQKQLMTYADKDGKLDPNKIDIMPTLSTKYCTTIIYGSLQKFNHGITFAKTSDWIDDYLSEEGNDRMTLFSLVMDLLMESGVMPKDSNNEDEAGEK